MRHGYSESDNAQSRNAVDQSSCKHFKETRQNVVVTSLTCKDPRQCGRIDPSSYGDTQDNAEDGGRMADTGCRNQQTERMGAVRAEYQYQ